MAATKQYLDESGLTLFWNNVKGYYSSNASNPAIVDNAAQSAEADKLSESRYVKLAGDASGKVLFDGSQNVTIQTAIDVDSIKQHEILTLFGKRVRASQYNSMAEAIEAAGNGGTIVFDSNSIAIMLANPMVISRPEEDELAVFYIEGNTDLTVEIPENVVLDTSLYNFKVFVVENGATLEIKGTGTIKTTDYPAVTLGQNTKLIINGVTFNNSDLKNNILVPAGSNSDIWIKSGSINGPCFFPGASHLRIDDGTFTSNYGTALYIKNSSSTLISGGRFEVLDLNTSQDAIPDRPENAWAHNLTDTHGTGSAVVIEACNAYEDGNPKVSITGGTFINKVTQEMDGSSWPVLVIDYDDNQADMAGTMISYQYATVPGGHISSSTGITGEPEDGWYYFTDQNTKTITV